MKIKKVISILLIILSTFSLTACNSKEVRNYVPKVENESMTDVWNETEELNKNGDIMKINIQVGSENFTVVLYDEVAAQEFFTQIPMTLSMNELNGNEKFYYLPEALTTNSQKVGKVNNGDLMLFGSDCLVLFYKPVSTPYNYTKIGYIENPSGLAEALGKGNVEITFNKNN